MDSLERPRLTILLAGPRGFCAGVERAIEIVEKALEKYGRPVYVRHDIVHNKTVVEELEDKGAVFVEELSEVPEGVPVVFSAHGVPKSVPREAVNRKLFYLDATCPLVTKVHVDAERLHAAGRQIILIGHAGHPEVVGTMGQLPEDAILLVEDTQQAEKIEVHDPHNLAYVTQTTLSVDDCRGIVEVLTRRFPDIEGPRKEDICYATTNRQAAVKEVAKRCDALIVLGAPNSSNSNRLREVAVAAGCPKAIMIQRAAELDFAWLDGVRTLGITAGASAPEKLVQELIEKCRDHYDLSIEQVEVTRENIRFSLPRVLTA
jgi:4-hydroxy-3-methylbut-2-enyl diphosphate reductase